MNDADRRTRTCWSRPSTTWSEAALKTQRGCCTPPPRFKRWVRPRSQPPRPSTQMRSAVPFGIVMLDRLTNRGCPLPRQPSLPTNDRASQAATLSHRTCLWILHRWGLGRHHSAWAGWRRLHRVRVEIEVRGATATRAAASHAAVRHLFAKCEAYRIVLVENRLQHEGHIGGHGLHHLGTVSPAQMGPCTASAALSHPVVGWCGSDLQGCQMTLGCGPVTFSDESAFTEGSRGRDPTPRHSAPWHDCGSVTPRPDHEAGRGERARRRALRSCGRPDARHASHAGSG